MKGGVYRMLTVQQLYQPADGYLGSGYREYPSDACASGNGWPILAL